MVFPFITSRRRRRRRRRGRGKEKNKVGSLTRWKLGSRRSLVRPTDRAMTRHLMTSGDRQRWNWLKGSVMGFGSAKQKVTSLQNDDLKKRLKND